MFWLSEAYYGLLLIPLQFPGFYYSSTPGRYYGNAPFYSYSAYTIYFFPADSLPTAGFSKTVILGNSLMQKNIQRIMIPNLFNGKNSISKFDVFTGDLSKGLNAYLGNRYFDTNFYGTMGYLNNYNNGSIRNAGVLSVSRKFTAGYFRLFATTKKDLGIFLKSGYLKLIMGYQDSLRYDIHISSRSISMGLRDNKVYVANLVPLKPPLFSIYFWINQDKKYVISPSYILTENFSVYAFKSNENAGIGIHSSILNMEVNKDRRVLCGLTSKHIQGFFIYKNRSMSGGIKLEYLKAFKNGKLSPEVVIQGLREDSLTHIDIRFALHIIDAAIYTGLENLTEAHYNIKDGLLPDGYMRYYWGITWHFTN